MEILNPIWLVSLISIPLVLIFLLISKKHRKIQVPSLLIWKRIVQSSRTTVSKSKRLDLMVLLIIFTLVFICLTLGKLAIAQTSEKEKIVRLFIDDSALMNYEVEGFATAKEFVLAKLKELKESDKLKLSAYFPVSGKTLSDLILNDLESEIEKTEFSGFIIFDEYESALKGFIQASSSDSTQIIFTPYDFTIIQDENILTINLPFNVKPEFVEYLGFENDSILVRLNGNNGSKIVCHSIDNANTEYAINGKVLSVNDLKIDAGCFTVDGKINQYFARTAKLKIGTIGVDQEFIDFANKILRNVEFSSNKTLTDADDIAAWLISDKVTLPDNFRKPIVYLRGAENPKLFKIGKKIDGEIEVSIANSDLLTGVSVAELNFDDAQKCELVAGEWGEKLIQSNSNVLAGTIRTREKLDAFVNIAELDKNNVSSFTLILNLLEHLTGEKIIERADYFNLTSNEFFKLLDSRVKSAKEVEISMFEKDRWVKEKLEINSRNYLQILTPMLKSGAIVSIDENMYAVNPEISDLSEHIQVSKSVSDNKLNALINRSINAAGTSYINLDTVLLILAIVLLFALIYFKKEAN